MNKCITWRCELCWQNSKLIVAQLGSLMSIPIQGGQKSGPLRLTTYMYIFKPSEPICLIFGTIQLCFYLNTSVNPILNKFMTQVVPPSDKINNSVFHLQNQARLLLSNAHIFKIPTPICTSEHRDIILNRPVTSISSIA